MNTMLRKEILTATYEDMQNLIFETAWKYWRRNGGDIEDLVGQANLSFIRAVDSYDESKSELTTWIVVCINQDLRNYMVREYRQTHISIIDEKIKHSHLSVSNEGEHLDIQDSYNSISVMELLDEMEKDAHIILQLFLETPKEVIMNVLEEGRHMNHLQGYMRRRLRNRLRQMGWTIERIKKSFNEIKAAIS